MTSDLRRCAECGAALEDSDATMAHWDWHRDFRARLRELEGRVEELELERAAAIDARREAIDRG